MKLSEAITIGSKLRPESHQERFCHVENRGLCSDVWGAACEAVDPSISRRSWNVKNIRQFENDMNALRAIQDKYFAAYFQMPARCPMAHRSMFHGAGRVVNSKGEYVVEEGGKMVPIAGVTSECPKVQTLAGYVDHAFYKHGNSREELAEIVREYEESRDRRVLLATEHYQNDQVRQRIAARSVTAARQREKLRNTRRVFAVK